MKTNPLFLSALAIAGLAVANAQETTTPVGYVSLGNTGGGDAVPANTDQRIAIPMLNATEFTGVIDTGGVNPDNLTIAGASFTVNEYAGYYCQITSGTNDGQFLLVTANTSDTLTVQELPGDSQTGIAVGDSISLSQAWTVSSLLGDRPVGTRLFAFSGTSTGINIAANITYEYGNPFSIFPSDRWYNTGDLTDATNAILFPGEGLIIRTGATPLAELVISGSVPLETNRTIIFGHTGQQDSPIAFFSPVDEPILSANLPSAVGDRILLFNPSATGINKAPSTTYEFGNPFSIFASDRWYNTGTLTEVTTEVLPAGSSFVYRTGSASADTAWTDDATYNTP